MTSHTPGPWELRDVVGAGFEIYAPVQLVETIKWPGNGPDKPIETYMLTGPAGHKLIACEIWVQFKPEGWKEMQRANGQLISAAPDLLDACEALLAELKNSGMGDSKTCNLAESAIEKAEP